MKKLILKTVSVVALVGTLSTTAVADETQFGLGVGVNATDSTTLRGTISLQNSMRLEPYLGFSYKDPSTGDSQTTLNVGSALDIVKPINDALNAYYGGFIGISSYDNGTSETIFNCGPVAGVEYILNPQFTFGAEMKFNFGFGDETILKTDSSVVLRYYF